MTGSFTLVWGRDRCLCGEQPCGPWEFLSVPVGNSAASEVICSEPRRPPPSSMCPPTDGRSDPSSRHKKNREAAVELLMRLKDNRDLQKFLQECQEVSVTLDRTADFLCAQRFPGSSQSLCCVCSVISVDQREDADGSGHDLRRGQEPAQQVAEAPGLHGGAAVQQGVAGQDREGTAYSE